MANENNLLLCYNKGCGKQFNPLDNPNDACKFHSGVPVFHDAYKGWSCCNKKCTDFTEFLNIPGCTVAQHSNIKPPEEPKPVKESNPEEVIVVKPIVAPTLERPPLDTPMVTMKPELAPSLKQQKEIASTIKQMKPEESNSIPIGTVCKNGGCSKGYEGPDSDLETCIYHPGYPVFHEGMKFWSCCTKRTSDFNSFLNQEGCGRGSHKWFKDEDKEIVECRWDWHQTGNFVVLAIYAKKYCPYKSIIQLNPIRVTAELIFPEDGNSFKLDLELSRVIDVNQSQVSMYGTKVEIKMRKAEPGSWAKLHLPKLLPKLEQKKDEIKENVEDLTPKVDAVDLDDL